MCLFEKDNGMTSINFERNQILCDELERLSQACGEDRILLITAGLDALLEVRVSDKERERASSMEAMTARRFLSARRLVRGVFSKLLGIPVKEIVLELNAYGKPSLAGTDHYLSIAHSGEVVAIAVSRSEIGVDLEFEREIDIPGLSRRFFSPEEALYLEKNSDPSHFFRLWTCREAAIKADGRGLGHLLGKTKVAADRGTEGDPIDVTISEDAWTAFHWREAAGMHLATAFRKRPSLISWCDLRRQVIV